MEYYLSNLASVVGVGQSGESGASKSHRSYGVSENRLPKSVIQTYETYRQHKQVGDQMRMETDANRAARQEHEAKLLLRGRREWEKPSDDQTTEHITFRVRVGRPERRSL